SAASASSSASSRSRSSSTADWGRPSSLCATSVIVLPFEGEPAQNDGPSCTYSPFEAHAPLSGQPHDTKEESERMRFTQVRGPKRAISRLNVWAPPDRSRFRSVKHTGCSTFHLQPTTRDWTARYPHTSIHTRPRGRTLRR